MVHWQSDALTTRLDLIRKLFLFLFIVYIFLTAMQLDNYSLIPNFCYFLNPCFICHPLDPLCRRMLGLKPGTVAYCSFHQRYMKAKNILWCICSWAWLWRDNVRLYCRMNRVPVSPVLHRKENPIYVFPFLWIAWPQSQFPHSIFIFSQNPHISLQQNRQTDLGNI
jgi:hypothetical protein